MSVGGKKKLSNQSSIALQTDKMGIAASSAARACKYSSIEVFRNLLDCQNPMIPPYLRLTLACCLMNYGCGTHWQQPTVRSQLVNPSFQPLRQDSVPGPQRDNHDQSRPGYLVP